MWYYIVSRIVCAGFRPELYSRYAIRYQTIMQCMRPSTMHLLGVSIPTDSTRTDCQQALQHMRCMLTDTILQLLIYTLFPYCEIRQFPLDSSPKTQLFHHSGVCKPLASPHCLNRLTRATLKCEVLIKSSRADKSARGLSYLPLIYYLCIW